MKKILYALVICCLGILKVNAQQSFYDVTATNGNGIRFWSSDTYKIHMGSGSEYFYGPVQDYSIKMNMSGGLNNRGWTWGVAGQTPIAAINILGNMQIAGTFSSAFTYVNNTIDADNGYTRSNFGSNVYWDASNNQWNITAIGANDFSSVIHPNGDGLAFITSSSDGNFSKSLSNSQFMAFERMRIKANGNVGIGTNSPEGLLHLGSSNLGVGSAKRLVLEPPYHTGAAWQFTVRDDVGSSYLGIGYGAETFTIHHAGNIGIGTTSPDAKLAVKGTIHANEVKVDLNGAVAPDYVFNSDYNLLSLEEIKIYIDKNKHLPEVPSAKEMEANGVQLGEMNMLLLKKIEELTLYTIDMNKKLLEMSVEIALQREELHVLKSNQVKNK